MARGLPTGTAAQAGRGTRGERFGSVEELWRRAGVPVAALERLAEADAYAALASTAATRSGRSGAWRRSAAAVRGGRPAQQPRRSWSSRRSRCVPMKDGRQVVEDYRSVGLSLRQPSGRVPARHAASGRWYLRGPAARARRAAGAGAGGGAGAAEAGLGQGRDVHHAGGRDRGGEPDPVAGPFEKQRRLVLSAGMMACHGKVQREGEVTHVITDRLEDLSDLLRSVGERDEAFPLTHGRGGGATHPGARATRAPGRAPVRVAGRCATSTSPTCASGFRGSRCLRATSAERTRNA